MIKAIFRTITFLGAFWSISFLLVVPAQAANKKPVPSGIIGTVAADWNKDGIPDVAVLTTRGGMDADLEVFLSQPDGVWKSAIYAGKIAWHGTLTGRRASIKLNKRNSIVIHSHNESIGRHRWSKLLTIVYRNKRFLVAGYTADEYDTLDPGRSSSCDVNYLSGKLVKNKKSLVIKNIAPTVSDWLKQSAVAACR